MSVLEITKDWGIQVVEEPLTIDQVIAYSKEGNLTEVFGAGTAAIISPVKSFVYHGEEFVIGDGEIGSLSGRLYDYLLNLQYGRTDDSRGWRERIV